MSYRLKYKNQMGLLLIVHVLRYILFSDTIVFHFYVVFFFYFAQYVLDYKVTKCIVYLIRVIAFSFTDYLCGNDVANQGSYIIINIF